MDPRFQLSISEEVSQTWLRVLTQVLTACVFSSGSCGFALWRNDLDGFFFQAAGCGELTPLQR